MLITYLWSSPLSVIVEPYSIPAVRDPKRHDPLIIVLSSLSGETNNTRQLGNVHQKPLCAVISTRRPRAVQPSTLDSVKACSLGSEASVPIGRSAETSIRDTTVFDTKGQLRRSW